MRLSFLIFVVTPLYGALFMCLKKNGKLKKIIYLFLFYLFLFNVIKGNRGIEMVVSDDTRVSIGVYQKPTRGALQTQQRDCNVSSK